MSPAPLSPSYGGQPNRGYLKHGMQTGDHTRLNSISKVLPIVTSSPATGIRTANPVICDLGFLH